MSAAVFFILILFGLVNYITLYFLITGGYHHFRKTIRLVRRHTRNF